MLQGIENIVFDLGGVMIDLDRARCVEEFHKIGFTEIDDLIDSYHPKGFLGRLERGDVTNDDFYDYVRRSAGRDIADDEIRRAFTSFLAGIPRYKLQMVRTQRERGFRTYALSNINDVVFPFVRDVLFTQEGLQLDDYFEKAYLSYEMHELKPSPEIYRKMIEKSGMRPEARSSSTTMRKIFTRRRNWDSTYICPGPAKISGFCSTTARADDTKNGKPSSETNGTSLRYGEDIRNNSKPTASGSLAITKRSGITDGTSWHTRPDIRNPA